MSSNNNDNPPPTDNTGENDDDVTIVNPPGSGTGAPGAPKGKGDKSGKEEANVNDKEAGVSNEKYNIAWTEYKKYHPNKTQGQMHKDMQKWMDETGAHEFSTGDFLQWHKPKEQFRLLLKINSKSGDNEDESRIPKGGNRKRSANDADLDSNDNVSQGALAKRRKLNDVCNCNFVLFRQNHFSGHTDSFILSNLD